MTTADTFPGMDTARERLREKVDMFGEVKTVWNVPKRFHGEFASDPNLDTLYDESRARFPNQAYEWERWRIRFLWKQSGGETGGKCTLASPMVRYLANVDFVIWFNAEMASGADWGEAEMAALMYHELLHVSSRQDKDGISQPAIRKHDAETFADEIEAFGPWDMSLMKIERAFAKHARMGAAS